MPSWTETLFSFGMDVGIVGATKWCVHPRELVMNVEKVGGTKDPDVARIIALAPDLVVCEKEENRREDVEALTAAGLRVWTSDVQSVEDSMRAITSLGETVGRTEAAAALVARLESSLAHVRAHRPTTGVPVYVPIWRRDWMTIARGTYTDSVLSLCGARNVFGDDETRYPYRTPDDARAAGATAALLPSEPYPFAAKHVQELVDAGFDATRVLLVDGEALTWYGARAVEGVRQIAANVRSLSET